MTINTDVIDELLKHYKTPEEILGSNRVFTSHDNIVDHCCEAWNKLIDQPWHIMTIGRRKWARGS